MGLKERTLIGSGLTPCSARTGLVHAWFTGAKAAQDATEPPYDEFATTKNGLLDESDVQAITDQVWPEEPDEDFAE